MTDLYGNHDFFLFGGVNPAWRTLFEMAELELIIAGAENGEDVKRTARTARQVVHSGTYLDRSMWGTTFREPVITHASENAWIESWDVTGPPWSILTVPNDIKVACVLSSCEWEFTRTRDNARHVWKSRNTFLKMYRKWAQKIMNRTPWPCNLDRLREIRETPGWPSLEVYERKKGTRK